MRPFPSRRASTPNQNEIPPPALVLRRERPRVLRTVVERRAAPQTVVHNHIIQMVRQTVCPRRDVVTRLLSPPGREAAVEEDRSRPTLAARRLVGLFSAESARRDGNRRRTTVPGPPWPPDGWCGCSPPRARGGSCGCSSAAWCITS